MTRSSLAVSVGQSRTCTTSVTWVSKDNYESKMTLRLRTSFRTLLDKAPRLEERLVMLLGLGPEGLSITMSMLESFNRRTFFDIHFYLSKPGQNTRNISFTRL